MGTWLKETELFTDKREHGAYTAWNDDLTDFKAVLAKDSSLYDA